MILDVSLGFKSLNQEFEQVELSTSGKGKVPKWLKGSLICNGAAKFELGKEKYLHWFDGLAMLHRFAFADGKVIYSNKFLKSQSYLTTVKTGKISFNEFSTGPSSPWKRRWLKYTNQLTDNASVNIAEFNNRFFALTETPNRVEFNPLTLETKGSLNYGDQIRGHLTTVHPQYDFTDGQIINYTTNFSLKSSYNIFTIKPGTTKRKVICTIPVKDPSYMHNFAITKNFIILTQYPLVIKPWNLLTKDWPFIRNLIWEPDRGTTILLISKKTGQIVGQYFTEAFFAFHHINAFEKDGEVLIDYCAYENSAIIESLYLDRVTNRSLPIPIPQFRRYGINLKGTYGKNNSILKSYLGKFLEFPRFNYLKCNGKDYNIIYGIGSENSNGFNNQLIKFNIKENNILSWYQVNCYPAEPVFVPRPKGESEDDGLILSVVLDTKIGRSFLLILDARNFKEVTKLELPHHIPFLSHSQFFNNL